MQIDVDKLLKSKNDRFIFCLILFDAKNIPIGFLNYYIEEVFVREFLDRSDIQNEDNNPPALPEATTQIIREYIISKFNKIEIKAKIHDIVLSLENYTNDAISKENSNVLRSLISNLEYIIRNEFIDENIISIIQSILGVIYNSFSEYEKAQNFLELSLCELKKDELNNSRIAYVTANLGANIASLGNNIEGARLIEESLSIYMKIIPQDTEKIAQNLQMLGNIYRRLGRYNEASESLDKSLSLIKEQKSINYTDLTWVLLFIGYNYEELGQYTRAANFFKESLKICRTHLSNNFIKIAWAAANLGNMQAKLGNLDYAEKLIDESLELCKKNLPKPNRGFGLCLIYAGSLKQKYGNLIEAENLLNKGLEIFQ